jgi:hypothetical protein
MRGDGGAPKSPDSKAKKRRATGRRLAGGDGGPVNWRQQHHPLGEDRPALVRAEISAEDGPVTYAMRAPDTIDALVNKGRIDDRAAAGARKYEAIFHSASLHGLANRDIRVTPGSFNVGSGEPHHILAARDEIWAAMRALGGIGSPGANAAWDVLGLGMTIKAHAERCQFGNGRSLNPMTATGILVQACFTLAAHFGR